MATTTVAGIEHSPLLHHRHRWIGLTLLCVCQLMLILDVTVVNVALPAIGADLRLRAATLPWVMTAYTLAFGGLMLLGGRVADLFGARRVLLIGLVVFTSASLLTGLSSGAAELIGGRGAQGLGAAFMSPAALSLVTTSFAADERAKALGVWSAISGAGAALGVVLGGVLTSSASWRWVFFINAPIGVMLLLALPALVSGVRPSRARSSVDLRGALIVTGATGSAIYGLINVGSHGWSAPSTVLPLVASVLLYALFVGAERSAAAPLIQVRLLTQRPVLTGSLLMLVATGLLVGSFFLGSFYLQRERGYSAVHTGLLFLPIALATMSGAHLASRALGALDARLIASSSLALAAAGAATAGLWLSPVTVIGGLTVAALGIGAVFVTAFTASLTGVRPHESGLRSAVVNTFHELGGAVGVAVVSSLVATGLTGPHPGTSGFTHALAVCAIAALAVSALAAFLVPAGRAEPGHAPHAH